MRITDLLTEDGILIGAAAATKEEAITMLVSGPDRFGCVTDPAVCRADVLARESLGTTALSHGVAVPHAKSRGVKERGITVMTVPNGIDFGAVDGPSRLIFLLVGPENDDHGERHDKASARGYSQHERVGDRVVEKRLKQEAG